MAHLDVRFDDLDKVVSGNIQSAIKLLDSLDNPTELFNYIMDFSAESVRDAAKLDDPGMFLQGIATIIGLVMIRMAKSEEIKRAQSPSHS